MFRRLIICLAIITVVLPVRTGRAAEPGKGAVDPVELLERQAKAVATGDEPLFLSTFSSASTDAKDTLPAIEAFFEMVVVRRDFCEKLTKAYGADALTALGMGPDSGFKSLNKEDLLARPKTTSIKIDGDTGLTQSLFTGTEMKLVRENGLWLVDPLGTRPRTEKDRNPMVRAMAVTILKRIEHTLDAASSLIGQPGQTPETIKAFLEKPAPDLKSAH